MPETLALPSGWTQSVDRSTYDRFMDREYTTVIFEHASTNRRVMVNEVQEPNNFGGWGYLVHVTDPTQGELGLVNDLETAVGLAEEFMESHSQ
ncbi:MAG: hypothetical protein ACI8XM_002174 [Haloarculaceae archaeon]|jgi:hypothetical protein